MRLNRKTSFKIHGWIGIKLSILFFIVCFSGTLATLSSEMDWLVQPAIRATPQAKLADKNTMVRALQAAVPDQQIVFWQGARAPYLCDVVSTLDNNGKRTYVFVNPYTGMFQGTANLTIQRYFRDLHYYLFIPFQVGHFTVLLFAFLLFASLITALYFYRSWFRKFFDLKRGKGSVVFFRSLHRLVGVWTIPFILLFALTGIWYFLERTNTGGIARIANGKAPSLVDSLPATLNLKDYAWKIDYDRAVDSARAHIPGLVVKDMLPPRSRTGTIYLTGKSEVALVRNRANRVYLHPLTYEVLKVQRADALPTVTWLNDIADPLHFGTFGGLLTKFLWFFAGLGISGLVLTGIWISLKRKVKNEAAIRAQRMGRWKYYNYTIVGLMLIGMYVHLLVAYRTEWPVLCFISAGWALLGWGGWYLFVHRLGQVANRARPQVLSKGIKEQGSKGVKGKGVKE